MTDFRIAQMQNSAVLYIYSEREFIQINPVYQRPSGIWTMENRQLLIDSIINEFDIPKLYFHEFVPARTIDGNLYKYAIIDGKQRLQSIWDFIDGKFSLSRDFEYLHDPNVRAGGLTYNELSDKYPRLRVRFDSTTLAVVTIQTDDEELIEEMFSRLNEAVPLNAPEKRNAFGGPIPPAIRRLSEHRFFKEKLPFPNTRYRHFDIITKFLYLDRQDKPSDTKKEHLDRFVKDFDRNNVEEVAVLENNVQRVLDSMADVFVDADPLLRSVGLVTVYYLLFRVKVGDDQAVGWSRKTLEEFEELRRANRIVAESDLPKANYRLLQFDSYAQALNDGGAMEYRLNVLLDFLEGRLDLNTVPTVSP